MENRVVLKFMLEPDNYFTYTKDDDSLYTFIELYLTRKELKLVLESITEYMKEFEDENGKEAT